MAVLNKIRQRSVFLIIIIALALFAFVLADVIRSGGFSSQKSQNTIASVNGKDIDRAEFARQVEYYQQNSGGNMSTSQAVNAVWEQKIGSVVLEEQLDALGIRVGEAQIKKMLRQRLEGNPNFTNEAGSFDEYRLQEYVANLKATSPDAYRQWLDFENSVAQNAREEIYFNMIAAGMGATLKEGEQAYRRENDKVDVEYVQIPYTTVPDNEVEVSKEEIKSYMKDHSERFQTEASRNVQYVYFPETASASDDSQVKERLAGLVNDRQEYNPVTKQNDTIAGFASSSDVETFVNQNSDVEYANRFFFKNELPKEHADAIFNLSEGEVYGPYKVNNSWKISRVLETKQMPDSAKAKHILIGYQGGAAATQTNRTKEEAKTLADSLLSVLKADRSKFSDLASEFSEDASNKDNAGDLGFFTPGRMVPAFNDFVFENNEGDLGVVETRFGYHIISIDEQTSKEKAVKVATISQRVEASEQSLQDLFRETTKFEMAANDGDFTEAAKEANYNVRPVQEVKELDENVPGLGSQRALVQWAFNEDTEAGDIKRFDHAGGYVVAQVTAVNEEGLMSVENASSTVTPILKREKKAEIIKNKISSDILNEIAKANNTSVQSANAVNLSNPTIVGAGREPKVVGVAFGLNEGEVSKPITGNKGVYVVKLLKKTKAADLPNYRSFANQETGKIRQTAGERVLTALKDAAEIEDNRARFY